MHCRGWRSIYCMPRRPAFKGTAPINLSDRLNQVFRWALGSVEIFYSRNCPLWCGLRNGHLKLLQRIAYINTVVYPFTSFPLIAYCLLPTVSLLSGKFIIPTLSGTGIVWFLSLVVTIILTGVLELWWSGVAVEEWWRNEQFWVIGGVSAHFFAVLQGVLKMVAGVETKFKVTAKVSDHGREFGDLYTFKWTALLIPPTTILAVTVVGILAGCGFAFGMDDYGGWRPLIGKLIFAMWVIVHLYPFFKGLVAKQNHVPTVVIFWSVLLAAALFLGLLTGSL